MEFDSCLHAPSEWRRVSIDSICSSFTSGGTPSRKKPEYFESGVIPWVKTKELLDCVLDDAEEWITEEAILNSSAKRLPPRTLLMAMYGATVGQLGILGREMACNQACAAMVVDDAQCDYRFLYYQLLANRRQIVSMATGAAQQNLSGAQIKRWILPLPDKSEQQRIVAVLWSLDERISLLRETNATLEAIAQALFKSWFVDFDPVRAKAEGREPEGMDAATADLFPSEFENSTVGAIPAGWQALPFGSLLRGSIGGDWGTENPDERNFERVIIIRGTDIPDLRSQAELRTPVRYSTPKKVSSRQLVSGDLVVEISGGSKDQPTGRSVYITEAMLENFDCAVVPASFCRRFSPSSTAIGILLSQHMDYIYASGKTWEYQNQSTGIANFQTKRFLQDEVVIVPTDGVLDRFCGLAKPIAERSHASHLRTLTALRDTLLPRLVSGKLHLPEAEREIEAATA